MTKINFSFLQVNNLKEPSRKSCPKLQKLQECLTLRCPRPRLSGPASDSPERGPGGPVVTRVWSRSDARLQLHGRGRVQVAAVVPVRAVHQHAGLLHVPLSAQLRAGLRRHGLLRCVPPYVLYLCILDLHYVLDLQHIDFNLLNNCWHYTFN